MQIFLFFALFISILAIIFAVQNNDTTSVSFLVWKSEGSLALVLLISLATGALISYLASLPGSIKSQLTIRNQKKKIAELEASLEGYKSKPVEKPEEVEKATEVESKAIKPAE